MSQKFRNVAITDYDVNIYSDFTKEEDTLISYMCFQKEKCPKTDKEHLQVYVEFKRQVRMKFIKDIFGDKVHIEACKGSQEDNIKYCTKVESRLEGPWEFGTKKEPGKRNDLLKVKDEIMNGNKLSDIALDNVETYIKYGKGIKEVKYLFDMKDKSLRKDMKVYVLWGTAGNGKTYKSIDMVNDNDWFKINPKPNKNLWFDGYDGENTLIIDEFNEQFPIEELLAILDIYPLRLEIKGGYTCAKWKEVIITSQFNPLEWYKYVKEEQKKALLRRITNIVEY